MFEPPIGMSRTFSPRLDFPSGPGSISSKVPEWCIWFSDAVVFDEFTAYQCSQTCETTEGDAYPGHYGLPSVIPTLRVHDGQIETFGTCLQQPEHGGTEISPVLAELSADLVCHAM